ncbi:MAG: malonyl-CoA decarboxylase family protein [Actinomycetota bacterium]
MVFATQITRVIDGVRRRRGQVTDTPIPVHPDLPESGWKRLKAEIDATVDTRGGPVAARRRATTIGLTYRELSAEGRLRFLTGLGAEYGNDDEAVDRAIDAVQAAEDQDTRRRAESELRACLETKREVLLRRFAGPDGGLPLLIQMRADLLPHRQTSPELAALERDLRSILEGWFDVGLLRLERLTWSTSASFLEKLIQYEAVHAIESWADLKHRLGPGRRCYAFVHPAMPDDPLIFVEVALTKDIARDLGPLMLPAAQRPAATEQNVDGSDFDESDFDTAIFYSISNCHDGLAGVSLGDFLIKSVVEELSDEMRDLRKFATLSPIPGFRTWLTERLAAGDLELTDDDGPLDPAGLEEFTALVSGPLPGAGDPGLDRFSPTLVGLAARYLMTERSPGRTRALDPVAHFHLSNGARVEHINWLANRSATGWDRGLAMMVNYRYSLRDIERNHDRYADTGEVAATDGVKKLLDGG